MRPPMVLTEDWHWTGYPDGKVSRKKVGKYILELYYGTNRGGHINIWEPGYKGLEHVWTPSDDKKWHKTDEVGFMDWENAVQEYRDLKTVKDVINLMWRNR